MQYIRDHYAIANQLRPTMPQLKELLEHYVHAALYNNLDVVLGRRHPLDPYEAYIQTVEKEQGGMCIDHNLSFYHLLSKIGYDVHLTEGHSLHYNEHPMSFAHSAHMLLIVTIDNQKYVVDPGFGNSAREPLPLTGELKEHPMGTFKVCQISEDEFGVAKVFDNDYVQYTFNPNKVMECSDFEPHLDYIHSDESLFRTMLFITKSLPEQVISLMDTEFKVANADGEKCCDVSAKGGLRQAMLATFGLPKDYVDNVNWDSASVVDATKSLLQSAWLPPKLQMCFSPNTKKTQQPEPTQSTLANKK